jgi:hypothetical protein
MLIDSFELFIGFHELEECRYRGAQDLSKGLFLLRNGEGFIDC